MSNESLNSQASLQTTLYAIALKVQNTAICVCLAWNPLFLILRWIACLTYWMKKEQCASHAAVYFASFPERSNMIARLVKAPAENMVNEEKKLQKSKLAINSNYTLACCAFTWKWKKPGSCFYTVSVNRENLNKWCNSQYIYPLSGF